MEDDWEEEIAAAAAAPVEVRVSRQRLPLDTWRLAQVISMSLKFICLKFFCQQELPEIKLFDKWSTDDVVVNDISLTDYIAVKEKFAKYLPHSAGRYAAKRFRKAQVSAEL